MGNMFVFFWLSLTHSIRYGSDVLGRAITK